MRNIVEGFGEGARAQISSNVGDSTLFGGGSGGDPMAANAYGFGSMMYNSQNEVLQPTTAQEYQSKLSGGGGRLGGGGYGSSGAPNYAGHRPVRPIQQPEFTPEIQNQLLRYERALAAERRKNAMKRGGSWFGGINTQGGLIGQVLGLVEQIFRFVLAILNILIGWLF